MASRPFTLQRIRLARSGDWPTRLNKPCPNYIKMHNPNGFICMHIYLQSKSTCNNVMHKEGLLRIECMHYIHTRPILHTLHICRSNMNTTYHLHKSIYIGHLVTLQITRYINHIRINVIWVVELSVFWIWKKYPKFFGITFVVAFFKNNWTLYRCK